MVLALMSCANMGATNTTLTNVGVTSYEVAGASLTQAYNTEKMLFKAGTITVAQDSQFQLGVYADAVKCYKATGDAAAIALSVTDAASKATAIEKFNSLNAQLPALVANVVAFIQSVQK
jgi:hypothetical protein